MLYLPFLKPGLPYALNQAGLPFGLLLLVIVALITGGFIEAGTIRIMGHSFSQIKKKINKIMLVMSSQIIPSSCWSEEGTCRGQTVISHWCRAHSVSLGFWFYLHCSSFILSSVSCSEQVWIFCYAMSVWPEKLFALFSIFNAVLWRLAFHNAADWFMNNRTMLPLCFPAAMVSYNITTGDTMTKVFQRIPGGRPCCVKLIPTHR